MTSFSMGESVMFYALFAPTDEFLFANILILKCSDTNHTFIYLISYDVRILFFLQLAVPQNAPSDVLVKMSVNQPCLTVPSPSVPCTSLL